MMAHLINSRAGFNESHSFELVPGLESTVEGSTGRFGCVASRFATSNTFFWIRRSGGVHHGGGGHDGGLAVNNGRSETTLLSFCPREVEISIIAGIISMFLSKY
jgi:hypothetical protein